MGTSDLNAGGNPAMDKLPTQGDTPSRFMLQTFGLSSGLMSHSYANSIFSFLEDSLDVAFAIPVDSSEKIGKDSIK